jgi:DNA-binding response OmpR family regulator
VGEDDEDVKNVVLRCLEGIGEVQCHRFGHEILEQARAHRFDLIVLDNQLPDTTGQAVLASLRLQRDRIQAPVVMLTSRRDAAFVNELVALGIQDFIVKPFDPKALLRRVQAVLIRQKPVVLVADDDPLIRQIFRAKLSERNFEVHTAASGLQALEVAAKVRPHAIILDRSMPRMDGLDVLARIRSDPALCATPVLILSARHNDADVAEGLLRGADIYMGKPFLPETVVDRCAHLVRGTIAVAS